VFDVLERLGRELSLRVRVLGALESLPQKAECVLGRAHVAGGRHRSHLTLLLTRLH
jgi:hypothetical protein